MPPFITSSKQIRHGAMDNQKHPGDNNNVLQPVICIVDVTNMDVTYLLQMYCYCIGKCYQCIESINFLFNSINDTA